MATTKKLRYSVSEEDHTAAWEASTDVEYEEGPQLDAEIDADREYDEFGDPDYEEGVQADYDGEIVDPEYDEVLTLAIEEVVAPAMVAVPTVASDFAFELGRPVQPLTQQQAHPVVWRGLLKERHPATGLMQRVPVYLLGDGHWDCYREEELQSA